MIPPAQVNSIIEAVESAMVCWSSIAAEALASNDLAWHVLPKLHIVQHTVLDF